MNRLGSPGARMQFPGRREGAGGIVRQQRRNFQRNPAVHAVGPVVNRSKQIGGAGQILERQIEEQFLAGLALRAASRGWRRRRPRCS